MESYQIAVTETNVTYKTVIREDQFKYRPDRGWRWLQRVCLWLLQKIEAYVETNQAVYTRHTINPERITENLYMQKKEIISLYHNRGERVLIGPEEYHELTGNPETYKMLNISAAYRDGYTVMGMKITVIPWMKGILVVPRLG